MPQDQADFTSLRSRFIAGQDDPRACLERYIERIEKREKEVRAFVALNLEAARAAADAANLRYRAGRPLSPVDGMPVGIKDILETEDMPTEFGSPIYKGWRGNRDAAAVFALRKAGAVIVGKTVTTEFATRPPAQTHNPRDLKRTPGGSSSGSAAAVGDGMIAAALGSQVVGSVLRPASYCGVFGFKPSYGALNRGGGIDNFSQNCLGVLGLSLPDIWAVCHTIAAEVGGDPGCVAFRGDVTPATPLQPKTLAFIETAGWKQADPAAKEHLQAFRKAAESKGVKVLDRNSSPGIAALETAIADALAVSGGINAWEFRWPLNSYAKNSRNLLSKFMLDRLTQAEGMTDADYQALLAKRAAMVKAQAALKGQVDALVTLAAPGAAPVGLETTGDPIFNVPATALGAPALSLPIYSVDSMPLGLQLIGFPGEDQALSAVAGWALAPKPAK
jgi:Asp-tRNA(Asn)/Glu-tRNA(Gln) amidotransferase A subunit family amidase